MRYRVPACSLVPLDRFRNLSPESSVPGDIIPERCSCAFVLLTCLAPRRLRLTRSKQNTKASTSILRHLYYLSLTLSSPWTCILIIVSILQTTPASPIHSARLASGPLYHREPCHHLPYCALARTAWSHENLKRSREDGVLYRLRYHWSVIFHPPVSPLFEPLAPEDRNGRINEEELHEADKLFIHREQSFKAN